MLFIELIVAFALHAEDKNEAEQLYRNMESKLTSAKSLQCTYEGKAEGGSYAGSGKGSLALAAGNKSRLDLITKHGEDEYKVKSICDGEKMMNTATAGQEKTVWAAPKGQNDFLRAMLVRSGIVVSASLAIQVVKEGEQPKEVKADEELKVSDFKLGKKEKIGEQETQAIQYDLRIKKLQEPMAVTVWIDVKTKLPVKREIIAKIGDNMVTATERYADWSIDEKVDPKKLELPKD